MGAQLENATAAAAPFDGRSVYLAGSLCTSCSASCGPSWWGCWQDTSQPPGDYVRGFVSKAEAQHQTPFFTYYILLQASGVSEGSAEVGVVNDASFMSRYLGDFKFMLQQIGAHAADVHVEPDFWGYAQGVNSDPRQIPAQISGFADCSSLQNNLAGFAQCLVTLARKYAPNARIGLHGSSWATGIDAELNRDASVDVGAEARKTAAFLNACAPAADFIGIDASDRDAGWYESQGKSTWWDATNASLPSFHQAFAWAKALSEGAGKPVIYWQVPLGNASTRYRDNRVDYFFAHMDELAAAHVESVWFGPGDGAQTTAESDGGNLIAKVKALPLCR